MAQALEQNWNQQLHGSSLLKFKRPLTGEAKCQVVFIDKLCIQSWLLMFDYQQKKNLTLD